MIDPGIISPRWKPLATMLNRILDQIADQVPGTLGVAVTAAYPDGRLEVLAATGLGEPLVTAESFGGPVPDAAATAEPVVTTDLWADGRWPRLTLAAMAEAAPEHDWQRVRAVLARPGSWDHGVFVLSCVLDRAADDAVSVVLDRYGALVGAGLLVANAGTSEGTQRMLAVAQSRAAIEQAKGAIMGLLRCDAERAWNTLCRASQGFNIKMRELAVALVEHLGSAPAEQPTYEEPIRPGFAARRAAEQMWQALTVPDDSPRSR